MALQILGKGRKGRFVFLDVLKNKGWPAGSMLGKDPVYGKDGYCPKCRAPYGLQSGNLRLKSEGLKPLPKAWSPNWSLSKVCLDDEFADLVQSRFPDIELRDVRLPPAFPNGAEIIFPVTDESWFDPEELSARAIVEHGSPGETCAVCGRFRWFPVLSLPPLLFDDKRYATPVIACPEWFGAGGASGHLTMFDLDLAELIVEASPKNFSLSPG